MLKKICFLIFFLFFFFLLPPKANAVSVIINDPPISVNTEPFILSVSVTGASAGINYLRVDLYKDGTTQYFGETFTGSEWYGGSNGIQYFPITVPSDNPFTIQAKIGDTIPNDYDGTGNYKLRVRRYTAGGNYNNDEAKASVVPIGLSYPTPTVVPTNSPTPTHIPTPTRTPTPTKTPTSTPHRSVAQAPTLVPTPLRPSNSEGKAKTKSTGLIASNGAYPTVVLGASTVASKESQKSTNKKVLVQESSNSLLVTTVFVIGGLLLLACAILVYRRIKHESDTND